MSAYKDSSAESGYASGDSSSELTSAPERPQVTFTDSHLRFINNQLSHMDAEDILKWSITTFPNLYQTTALGLTGVVTIDLLSRLSTPTQPAPDAIFLDTLHHFDETLELLDRIRSRYPSTRFHVFSPAGVSTPAQFATQYGSRLWETDEDQYDYVAKVEPAARAYRQLGATAVLTGRRRSHGGARGSLPIVEVTAEGLVKINPLANWSYDRVREYIRIHDVPYNVLVDRGYKSIGDWHSTVPVAEGEDERAGRWQGKEKTECGIHNPQSRYAQYLRERGGARQVAQKAAAC